MKLVRQAALLIGMTLFLSAAQWPALGAGVAAEEASRWVRWVIPLPKEITISGKVEIPASAVRIRLRQGAGEVEKTAADELVALFREKSSADGSSGRFEILIGVCDAQGRIGDVTVSDAAKLRDMPNWEQAYVIRRVGEDRLVLTALDERGVYYAAQTLRQLLADKFAGNSVAIPLLSVTDWPDLRLRGQWGSLGGDWFTERDLARMAEGKLNFLEFELAGTTKMKEDGHVEVTIPYEQEVVFGRRRAMDVVPFITHLSVLAKVSGLYEGHSELRGKREEPAWAPCGSHPGLPEAVAEYLLAYARAGNTNELEVWLTEGSGDQCECPSCQELGQWVMETRAYVNAWRLARKELPELKIWIGLTQGSRPTNDRVLAEIPAEVGVTYYSAGSRGTYTPRQDPMIYPLLEDYAAKGGSLGVMPEIMHSHQAPYPWSCAQFIKYRMNEFADKKLERLVGYAPPSNRFFDFNVAATAEWSWNAKGRSEREFAVAWATRNGMKFKNANAPTPEAAEALGEWASLCGPVSWDLYGPQIPKNYLVRGLALSMIRSRTKPALGKGMFRHFPTVQSFEQAQKAVEEARGIVKRLDAPALLEETKFVEAALHMTRALYDIMSIISATSTPSDAQRAALQDAFTRLTLAGVNATGSWESWVRTHTDTRDISSTKRYRAGLTQIMARINEIGDNLAPLGVRKLSSPYLQTQIGEWRSEDFNAGPDRAMKWDVTGQVTIEGNYEVAFYRSSRKNSHFGLRTHRVALASAPADGSDDLAELSVDEHEGYVAPHLVDRKGYIYRVKLERHDGDAGYFICADVTGHPEEMFPGGLKGCNGTVWIKAMAEDDAMATPKLIEEEGARAARVTTVEGEAPADGIGVGVVQGGWGDQQMLDYVGRTEGVYARPVALTDDQRFEGLRVVIVPAFREKRRPSADQIKALNDFVRSGGGLIIIFQKALLQVADVCTFEGAPKAEEWEIVEEHPVTEGLDRVDVETLLVKIYPGMDGNNRVFTVGPKGIALARTAQTRQPVLVVGPVGRGHLVACGLLLGADERGAEGLTDEARILLENMVKWAGGEK